MMIAALRTVLIALLLALPLAAADEGTQLSESKDFPKAHNEWTVSQLQAAMAAGTATSEEITKEYIARILAIDQNGPGVNAVIELNPDALEMARHADQLRRH